MKRTPYIQSELKRAIHKLEKHNYNVIPTTDNGKKLYYITRSGEDTTYMHKFSPSDIIKLHKSFISKVYVSKAKANVKKYEHSKARTKERECLQPLQGDLDDNIDDDNLYDSDHNSILGNKHFDDIWAYD